MTREPYRSFLPALNMLCFPRKGETQRQYGRRFEATQKRFGRLLWLRNRIDERLAAMKKE